MQVRDLSLGTKDNAISTFLFYLNIVDVTNLRTLVILRPLGCHGYHLFLASLALLSVPSCSAGQVG